MTLIKPLRTMAACLCLLACAPVTTAQTCDPAQINLADSALGMNYAKMAASPIAEILSQGEQEYLSYSKLLIAGGRIQANHQRRLWRNQVKGLLRRKLPENSEDIKTPNIMFFRLATPNMFQALRRCVDPNNQVLGYIAALPEFPAVRELNH